MKGSRFLVLVLVVFVFVGCTRVETGEVGLRRTFNGTIEPSELSVGYHQTLIGDVILFATKEILLEEENLTPQTKDKTTLTDFDVTFTYNVDPQSVAELYTKYSITAHLSVPGSEEIFPMGSFVGPILRNAVYTSVSEHDALAVNDNRKSIEENIKKYANSKLEGEGLNKKVTVNLVNIKNIQLAPDIIESANKVVKTQNELTAKKTEVQIAIQEGLRIQELSKQTDAKYVELLNAQSQMKMSEAIQAAAGKGSTVWIVPSNFTALGNVLGK